jgi:hypothetical protein
MTELEILDEYMVIQIEWAGMPIEARWRGGNYINYFANGEEFACAYQIGKVSDLDTLRAFVLENLPYNLGIEDGEEELDEDETDEEE